MIKRLSVFFLCILMALFVVACSGGTGHTNISSNGTAEGDSSSDDPGNDPGPTYTNDNLEGPWVLSVSGSSAAYPGILIIDTEGKIVASYLYGTHASGYKVNPDGTFSIDLTNSDGATIPLSGKITSDTLASWTASLNGQVLKGDMHKVPDTSICKGWWIGSMQEDGSSMYPVPFGKIYVNAEGEVFTLLSYKIGYMFSIDNVVTAYFFKTGISDDYDEFIVKATLSDGKINGRFQNKAFVEGTFDLSSVL